jgi:hypothetical protein
VSVYSEQFDFSSVSKTPAVGHEVKEEALSSYIKFINKKFWEEVIAYFP